MSKVRVKISDERGLLVADYEADVTEDGKFELRAPTDDVGEYRVTVEVLPDGSERTDG